MTDITNSRTAGQICDPSDLCCPNCGDHDPLDIAMTVWAGPRAYGVKLTTPTADRQCDHTGLVRCTTCGCAGTVAFFQGRPE